MAQEMTFGMIKPNGIKKNAIGAIVEKLESGGLKLTAAKLSRLSKAKVEEFYAEHKGKPFYPELVNFIISGPVFLMALSGKNAVDTNRKIMGATDPKKAEKGTIRAEFGDSIGENTIHGSDSPTSAARELSLFFDKSEFVNS